MNFSDLMFGNSFGAEMVELRAAILRDLYFFEPSEFDRRIMKIGLYEFCCVVCYTEVSGIGVSCTKTDDTPGCSEKICWDCIGKMGVITKLKCPCCRSDFIL